MNKLLYIFCRALHGASPASKKIKTDFPGKSAFFESPITHKRFIFEHSYISYGKRQKSCTLIVILVILSYQTSPIFNSSSKSTGFFFFANEEVNFFSQLFYIVKKNPCILLKKLASKNYNSLKIHKNLGCLTSILSIKKYNFHNFSHC